VGAATNTINGDINTVTVLGPPNTSENNLLNIFIDAQQDLVINGGSAVIDNDGGIFFNSVALTPVSTALLDITGSGDVTIDDIDVSDAGILALTIDLTGFTGVLDPDLIVGGGTETVTITNGDVTAGTAVFQNVDDRTPADGSISVFDASGFDGTLTIGTASFADTAGGLVDIDDNDFTFTAGNGVTKVMLADSNLSASILPTDDGWNFDFSGAAAGSELRIQWDGNVTPAAGSVLNIDMGPDGVLYIDNPTPGSANVIDLTNVNGGLPFFGPLPNSAHPIVLGPNVTLILTAAQANDLHITSAPGVTNSVVNIVGLGDTQVDFSGIDPSVAGVATLEDNDVTLAGDPTVPGGGANATILGAIGILLEDLGGGNSTLQGQTIRFTTVEQAEGHVVYPAHDRFIKVNDTGTLGVSSTNVVWLFDEIPHTLDTGPFIDATPAGPPYNASTHHGYDPAIGRLWLTPELIASASGDVEQLFDTLPSTILRVEFTSSDPLAPLFASLPIDRVVELVHFTDLASGPNATTLFFNDSVGAPTAQGEFIRNLDLRLGGDVALGDIQLGDIVTSADTDLASIEFQALTINSYRAVTGDLTLNPATNETLVSELYNNDNDGNPELGEFAAPDAPNVIGHIGVGGVGGSIPEFDLLTVNIDTHTLRTLNVGNSVVDNNRGEAIVIASITYDSDGADAGDDTAHLNITGANNVTIGFIDTSDAEISNALDMNLTGFTAILDPVLHVDNTEEVNIWNGGAGPANYQNGTTQGVAAGTAIFQEVEGNELSLFNAEDFGGRLIATLSQVDSTDDGADPAFRFVSGTGWTTVTLAAGAFGTPSLAAGSEWVFDFSDASINLGNSFDAVAEDSSLTIDQSAFPLGTTGGGTLTLIDAATIITGDVDLSTTTLDLTNNGDKMRFYVGAGNSLTITVDQAIALGGALDVEIVGEGTVYLVGDATDLIGTAIGANLHTAVVDASAVTIDVDGLGGDDDLTGMFELTLNGALAFDGSLNIGQTVIGSAFNDDLTIIGQGMELDYFMRGGLGDDTLNSAGTGDFTYLVDAGTDTIPALLGEEQGADGVDAVTDALYENDVIVVSSGATANATALNPGVGFHATSETSNAGIANIQAASGPSTIDLTNAQGPNGYNITGTGNDVLIGSAFADVINGGNDVYASTRDILTGNAGADRFVFNLPDNAAKNFTYVVTTQGVDRETIDFTGTSDDNAGNEAITVTYYRNNGTNVSVVVSDTTYSADIDFNDPASIATAVAFLLNAQPGIGASAVGAVVTVTGDNGTAVEISGVGESNVATLGADWVNGADPVAIDTLHEVTLTLGVAPTDPVTNGDTYSLTYTDFVGGSGIPAEVLAAGDTNASIVGDLSVAFTETEVTDVPVDNVLTVTDADGDNGAFEILTDGTAGFVGSGASQVLVGDDSDLFSADVITDFNGGEGDQLVFGLTGVQNLLSAGSALADYGTAYAAADAAFGTGGLVRYFYAAVTDLDVPGGAGDYTTPDGSEGAGLLFVDANTDGVPDLVVVLEGLEALGSFNSGWIA